MGRGGGGSRGEQGGGGGGGGGSIRVASTSVPVRVSRFGLAVRR